MHCSGCGFENPEGVKFCNECGASLTARCARCGFANQPRAKFCGECGMLLARQSGVGDSPGSRPQARGSQPVSYTHPHLAERIRAEKGAMGARDAAGGERKTITALFADLAGFTALARDLDPEDTRRIIDPALYLMMDAVRRYDGYVAQSLGDGIFALFGAPIAHEDHPQQALYAALRMQEAMRRYAERVRAEKGVPLQIRVGVNTGEVVVRSIRKDDVHTDYVPVGHSTNLAARLEGLANPGSIVVSEQTYNLIEGYFECKALGATQVKGLDTPINVYEVVGVGPLHTRMQVAARRGLARFVGRQGELEQLKTARDRVVAGQGQIVGVMGEPGVGKSRLFYEFLSAYCQNPRLLCLEAFSVSHGKASPYLPLIALLRHYFQMTPQDDERTRREKVMGKVLALDRHLEDTLPYLFALLGIAEPASPLSQMDSEIRRRRTFDALTRLLVRESMNQPLVLVFEDLHWLDSETHAFLAVLSDSLAAARILLLVNSRPEYRHEWGNKTYYTRLRLDPLSGADAQELLGALLGDNPTPHPLTHFILEKTAGTPFFMEEVVQALFEQQVLTRQGGRVTVLRPLADLRLPATVQGVLAARIDRLPPEEKALLQTLSVIGREFGWGLVRRVVGMPEGELRGFLARLQAAEFLYEQPAFPEVGYTFKHALTQEVAYLSLLIERRTALHEQTARAIEHLCQDRLEDHYGELAHHYGRSGNAQKAVEYLHLAAQQAVQRPAYTEAITHLTTALKLLETLPDSPERTHQELMLLLTLGAPLAVTTGFGSPETETVYLRARALCQRLGDTPQLPPVLMGLWLLAVLRAELPAAHQLGEQLFEVAQSNGDPALLLQAHLAVGMTLYYQGEFSAAQAHFEQEAALYDRRQHRFQVLAYGLDLGTSCKRWLALVLWMLGYPDRALEKSREAIALAHELRHSFSLAFSLFWAAMLHQFRRETPAAKERAEATVTLATENGFVQLLPLATLLRAWALAVQEQNREGIAQIRQGLAGYSRTAAGLARPQHLGWLAEAYGHTGQPEEGLSVLAEALAEAHSTQQRFYDAELYRLKGELLLKHSAVRSQQSEATPQSPTPNPHMEAEAEGCFSKAIEIARRQQAKSLELRATVSLARLWQQHEPEQTGFSPVMTACSAKHGVGS